MHRVGLIGFSLATLGCVRLNPSFDERQTDSGSASGGVMSSTGVASASASRTGGSSTSDAPSTTEVDTTESTATTLQAVEFTDQTWEGEFAEAEGLGPLDWLADSIQLPPSVDVGRLESRIFDAGSDAVWSELRWTPRAPYGTPLQLPVGDEDVSYPAGNTGLAALEFLAHLDAGPFANNDVVADATGQYEAAWLGSSTANIPGVFQRALGHTDDNDTDAFRIELTEAVEPGMGPFTWTLWYRSESCAGTIMLALDASPGAKETGLYFMSCGGNGECLNTGSRYALAFIRGPGDPLAQVCSDVPIDDGVWHHLALRRQVNNEGQVLEMFVDGRLAGGRSFPVVTDVSVHLDAVVQENFTLAGGNEGIHSGAGEYDEFALWNRALSTEEVENLYNRGALSARFQVRACSSADCSDAAFVGPGDDLMSGYIDPGPQFAHAIDLSTLDLRGRYIQYRFQLRRRLGAPSPAIEAVTVAGTRQ